MYDPSARGFMSQLQYQTGFCNEFATEAIEGVLPKGQNSPQKVALGLYAEECTGTPFTAPRGSNRRDWLYRIRPSATHKPFSEIPSRLIRSGPFNEVATPPNQMRWDPLPLPDDDQDFIEGIVTMCGNGEPSKQAGVAIHIYAANKSMQDRYFFNADGEMLIIPELGTLHIFTELGVMNVKPNEICVIPRGIKFRVDLPEGVGRGYIAENYGLPYKLPELGPLGSNGLANPRDFQTPVAAFEDRAGTFQVISKFQGKMWAAEMDHSPLDVVAWHGNYVPYKYDLYTFNCINTVTYDHVDPSIYTVLTAPTPIPGTANLDFCVFRPRWMVAEHTFRPPWFHRNIASEFMGLIYGTYDAKAEGFVPGGASLHNSFSGHGPDTTTFERASTVELQPQYLDNTLAFLLETQTIIQTTKFALETKTLQPRYYECWQGLKRNFSTESVR
jgi:homogentisate 1,2-dioxygenase